MAVTRSILQGRDPSRSAPFPASKAFLDAEVLNIQKENRVCACVFVCVFLKKSNEVQQEEEVLKYECERMLVSIGNRRRQDRADGKWKATRAVFANDGFQKNRGMEEGKRDTKFRAAEQNVPREHRCEMFSLHDSTVAS